jgi:hypothetical protein
LNVEEYSAAIRVCDPRREYVISYAEGTPHDVRWSGLLASFEGLSRGLIEVIDIQFHSFSMQRGE